MAPPTAAVINSSERGWKEPLRAYLWSCFPEPTPFETKRASPPIWSKSGPFRDRRAGGPALKTMREAPRMRAGLLDLIAALPSGPMAMVEIGSHAGESAELFAASGKFNDMHCVDHWRNGDAERAFDRMRDRFLVIRKHKMLSVDAAGLFDDESFDFVYIDASHDYASVKADIAAWAPKVKRGGWIGGHDFNAAKFPGVVTAVREVFATVQVFKDDSWFTKKLDQTELPNTRMPAIDSTRQAIGESHGKLCKEQ